MRILLIGLIASFMLIASVPAESAASVRPSAQEIRVDLVPQEHLLRGECVLSYESPPGRLDLELDPKAVIDGVSSGSRTLPHTFRDGRLTILQPATGGPVVISIRYRLILDDPLPGAGAGAEDPSYGVNGSIGDRGVFLGTGVAWYPRPDETPSVRSVRIVAPAGMEGITSGERLSRETSAGTSRSLWREEPAVGELALSAGPYVIRERRIPGILVSTYLYPENASLADSYLDAASSYLTRFGKLFGPYPFTKFAVVENFFPTGYGFPSFTLLGSSVIRLPFMTTTSLPHEIAHSWWGNGVLVDSSQGNWCEGLVTYLADYLLEEGKGGDAGRDYRMRLLSDYSLLVNGENDFPLKGFSSRVDLASRAIGYGKGAMLWHMLRRRVGDEAFFASLRRVYLARRFQSAGWSDFTRALSDTSGQKLDRFMSVWIDQPGGPRPEFSDVASRREGGSWHVTGRVVQGAPAFPLLVPLRLETADARFDQTLPLDGPENSFHFVSNSRPVSLLLDPDADLFRLLPPERLPANVNRLKGSARLLGVRTAGCRASEADFLRFLQSIGQGGAKVVSEKELSGGAGVGHDLVFCGAPEDSAGQLQLPPGLELGRGSFVIGGERFDGPDDMLFLVTRQVADHGRVAALFLPLSPGAASRALTKISHYGSYSVLAFSAGVNRHKGRAVQDPSGDRVDFHEGEQK